MDLKGKRAIVLGGTSGIGLATVRQLVDSGARVVAGGRSADRIAEASKQAPGATFVQVDVLDRMALESLFTHHAGFEVLVNAATGGERATGPFLEMDLDGFQASFRKLWGYTNSVRLGAPQMSPDGAIVLVSGFPARKAGPGLSALSAVGNAVEGFVRAVAPEIAPRRINTVSPGVIDTPMFTDTGEQRAQRLARSTQNFPIKRAGTSDEVASAILFLLQHDYITGSVIDVDGGALLP
jgi:NAD(P)-dependent dehydrogenase (short-subunit alcohol dehydrogenase family)